VILRSALAALLLVELFVWAGAAAAQTAGPSTADPRAGPSPGTSRADKLRSGQLRGGWYPWDPYQYLDYSWGAPFLTGFDVEIQRAIERLMGVEIALPQRPWEEHLAALADGTADIAAGATWSEARSRHAWFSKPYRTETDVLILPRGASGRFPFRTVDDMLATFTRQKFRLGVIAGFVYADPRINAPTRPTGARSSPSRPTARTWTTCSPTSSTASCPIASPPRRRRGGASRASGSRNIRCRSPPTSVSC
jgi:ABC-type amino acid transport substrate-binding protein